MAMFLGYKNLGLTAAFALLDLLPQAHDLEENGNWKIQNL